MPIKAKQAVATSGPNSNLSATAKNSAGLRWYAVLAELIDEDGGDYCLSGRNEARFKIFFTRVKVLQKRSRSDGTDGAPDRRRMSPFENRDSSYPRGCR